MPIRERPYDPGRTVTARRNAYSCLLLQRGIVQPFTDKEIELAETFADQAVIAIESVPLFDRCRHAHATFRGARATDGDLGRLESHFNLAWRIGAGA